MNETDSEKAAYERGKAETDGDVSVILLTALADIRKALGVGDEVHLGELGREVTKAKAAAERRGMIKGMREAESIADAFQPVLKLLPLCNEGENRAALTGQIEGTESVWTAIGARAAQLEQENTNGNG